MTIYTGEVPRRILTTANVAGGTISVLWKMPSTSTPTKRRKATRLLTSSTSKSSVTLINALAPLLLLRLSWKSLLQDPTATTLTTTLLPSIFIIQSAFIILLLPFNPSSRPTKKRVVKIDTLGEALRSKATVEFP